MGSQNDPSSGVKTMFVPGGVQTYGFLTEAADEARTAGDEKAAHWFESAASAQRTRLLAWVQREQEVAGQR